MPRQRRSIAHFRDLVEWFYLDIGKARRSMKPNQRSRVVGVKTVFGAVKGYGSCCRSVDASDDTERVRS